MLRDSEKQQYTIHVGALLVKGAIHPEQPQKVVACKAERKQAVGGVAVQTVNRPNSNSAMKMRFSKMNHRHGATCFLAGVNKYGECVARRASCRA